MKKLLIFLVCLASLAMSDGVEAQTWHNAKDGGYHVFGIGWSRTSLRKYQRLPTLQRSMLKNTELSNNSILSSGLYVRFRTDATAISIKYTMTKSATQIAVIDCVVAVLAGLMIFPAAFSIGVSPDSGASLIFITLPNVFQQAFAAIPALGYVVSLLFFVLLSLAALTSLMSLHEVATAFFEEELHTTRKRAALLVTVVTSVIGAFCSLSLGATDVLTFAGRSLFDWFDFVTGQVFLPIVGFLTCLFVGWVLPHKVVRDEYTNWGALRGRSIHLFLLLVKYVCPLAILVIFLHQLGLLK